MNGYGKQNQQREYKDRNGNKNEKFRLNQQSRVKEPLSIFYKDAGKVFLMNGIAYKTAIKLQSISNSQLRKVLETVKQAVDVIRSDKNDITSAKTVLFSMLPMTAYNTSRAGKEEKKSYFQLLQFLYDNINEETICSSEDILMFDRIFTSVIAYHKYLNDKNIEGDIQC